MGHVHQTPLGIDKGPGNDDEQWMRICVQEQYLQHQAIVVLLNHRDILWTIILCWAMWTWQMRCPALDHEQ